jgi:LysM repeat protein
MSEVNEREVHVEESSGDGAEAKDDSRSEYIKFGVLAVIMLGAILVVALARPFIFGRLVPAVMGEGLTATPVDEEHDVFLPMNQAESEATATPAAGEGEAAATAVPEVTAEEEMGEEEETAEATAVSPQTHTVQPGETLTAIAEEYDVTVRALIDANQIRTPNRITPGTELVIPDSEE